MAFADRTEAANLLVEKLSVYKGKNPLILGIPRGAIPMAKIIADALGGELDVILVRKLGAPGNPEYAIGSVDETGKVVLGEAADMLTDDVYLESEVRNQLEVLRKRRKHYTPIRPPIDPKGRIVIVVDDGIATGSTMIAAVLSLRKRNPQKIIIAVPVAAQDSLRRIREVADAVVCLNTPVWFNAVGQFYHDFSQISDEEVVSCLSK